MRWPTSRVTVAGHPKISILRLHYPYSERASLVGRPRQIQLCKPWISRSRLAGAAEIAESNVTDGSQPVSAAKNTRNRALATNANDRSGTKGRVSTRNSPEMARAIAAPLRSANPQKHILRPRHQRQSHKL
ncbi:hypothetical protein FOQG_18402 [Fusarium oxysporum f. sp. raphani 54005]|uniref:Uncharacterized protein n=1 Tax=Fusarium oxysporum f. sp. raphani 54005 TaxID=1089458 RepID=X0B541_FUSOX|nr:hypothetical protein FOQG_18402 [Fusarium oxysporum f. sp. raphani 54005]